MFEICSLKNSMESAMLSVLTIYIWDLGQLVPYDLFDPKVIFDRHLSTAGDHSHYFLFLVI